jgi:hypothetical protein
MKLLSDYLDFTPAQANAESAGATANASPAPSATQEEPAGSPIAQLKRGMSLADVNTLLGPGKQLSKSVGDQGLKTSVYRYLTADRQTDVTFVDGVVVRFAISPNNAMNGEMGGSR